MSEIHLYKINDLGHIFYVMADSEDAALQIFKDHFGFKKSHFNQGDIPIVTRCEKIPTYLGEYNESRREFLNSYEKVNKLEAENKRLRELLKKSHDMSASLQPKNAMMKYEDSTLASEIEKELKEQL